MMRSVSLIYAVILVLLVNKKRLIKIGHTLNHWEWPFKYFGSYYRSLPNYIHPEQTVLDTKYKYSDGILKYTKSKTTEYERLYYHNVEFRKAMTPDEYFVWFYTDHQLPISEEAIKILTSLINKSND